MGFCEILLQAISYELLKNEIKWVESPGGGGDTPLGPVSYGGVQLRGSRTLTLF